MEAMSVAILALCAAFSEEVRSDMREDLEDAYGSIDWARTHLDPLNHAFKSWFDAPISRLPS